MNLPSRGERESAATTRWIGFFFEPTRVSLSFTAIRLPLRFPLAFGLRLARRARARRALRRDGAVPRHARAGDLRHLARSDHLHHLRHLLTRLEQLVDLLDRGARARGDPPAARGVDDVRDAP